MYALNKSHVVIAMALSLLWSGLAFGQGGTTPHSLGGYLGFTDRDDADFTFGGEYEYRMDRQFSAGAIVEHTPDVVFGQDFTLAMGTMHYRPSGLQRLKLTGGAGVEFKDIGGDDLKVRLGAGYDIFVEGPVSVTPRIAVDFGEGDENLSLGVTTSYHF